MERIRRTLAGWYEWWRTASGQDGQTLAEYGLIVTVVAVALVGLALIVFRDSLAGAFDAVLACLDGSCS
jgi:Flp pilus assembly pilin Flp